MKTQEEITTNNELQKCLMSAKSQNDLISISLKYSDIVIVGRYYNDGSKLLKTSAANNKARAEFWAKNSNCHFYLNGEII